MMTALRSSKHKDEEENLMPPRKNGLFGKKKNPRSEEPEKARASGNFFSKQQQFNEDPPEYEAPTPPTSPDSNVNDDSPVSNVMVVTTPRPQQDEMSDITDHRLRDPPAKVMRSPSNESPVVVMQNKLKSRGAVYSKPAAPPPEAVEVSEESFVTHVLGVVDQACTPTPDVAAHIQNNSNAAEQPDVRQNLSFAPEWGVAPSILDDSDDEHGDTGVIIESDSRGDTPIERGIEPEESEDRTNSTPPHKEDPPARRDNHEDFELVLQEEEELYAYSKSPNRRGWVFPKKLRGRNNKETTLGISKREDLDAPNKKEREVVAFPKIAMFGAQNSPVKMSKSEAAKMSKPKPAPKQPEPEPQEEQVAREPMIEMEEEEEQEKKQDDTSSPSPVENVRDQGEEEKREDLEVPYETSRPGEIVPDNKDAPEGKKTKQRKKSMGHPGKLLKKMRDSSRNMRKPAKEARLKSILSSFKPKAPLDTIDESEEINPNESTELKVRVPGSKGVMLSDNDLIGDEVLQETEIDDEDDEEESGNYDLTFASSYTFTSGESATNTGTSVGTNQSNLDSVFVSKGTATADGTASEGKSWASPEVNEMSDEPGFIKKSKSTSEVEENSIGSDGANCLSWKEKLGLTRNRSSSTEGSGSSGSLNRRQRSAPMKLPLSSASIERQLAKLKPKKKPQWKAVVDPVSGKTYYYHRVSRKTTWSKPPDTELVNPPSQPMEPEETEIKKMVEDEKKDEETSKEDKTKSTTLRKMSPRDFDPQVWKAKEQIASLLTNMGPPDGTTIERLMFQYEGREDELLEHLRDMSESRPFDEPYDGDEKMGTQSFRSRTRTATTSFSGFSNRTKASERTPLIRNTAASSSPGRIAAVQETNSHATSISSKEHLDVSPPPTTTANPSRRIPSKIPVPRARELVVEDLSTERVKSRTYEMKGVVRGARKSPAALPERPPGHEYKSSYSSFEANPYNGDVEETSKETDTASYARDSISALSETDNEFFNRKEDFDQARIRALDDAIAREDWDLAAALSEGMRSLKSKEVKHRREPKEWTQSELDRFISENDWDAVANYIAHVRANNKKKETSGAGHTRVPTPAIGRSAYKSRGPRQSDTSDSSQVQKRFGARSQLQHSDLHSVSDSWDSFSTDESEYSSGSYDSEEDRKYRSRQYRSRRGKEFAC